MWSKAYTHRIWQDTDLDNELEDGDMLTSMHVCRCVLSQCHQVVSAGMACATYHYLSICLEDVPVYTSQVLALQPLQ
jgi:hypothetical protein